MYKIIFIFASVFLFSANIWAGTPVKGNVKDDVGENLWGAYIHWSGIVDGVLSDEDGNFTLETVPSTKKLVFSYTGFSNDTIEVSDPSKPINIQMSGGTQLSEVVVVAPGGTINSRINPIQMQTITSGELCRAACCNLAESFETNPSVDVSYSDAATGARQIRLLGLSGTYVQMLTEQVPNFRGAASLYGLGYVPGPWMESIQVSKGTSSVKNGYEALTGQINVEYKKPQVSDYVSANLFAADNGRAEVNVDANVDVTPKLSTGLLLHYSNESVEHDGNKDGFMDLPKTEQINALNRWYYKGDNFISQAAVNYTRETRTSGQMKKSVIPGTDRYMVDILTNRGSFFTKNAHIFNKEKNTSMALIFSGSLHDQKSTFGKRDYDVNQHNLYGSLLFETEFTPIHRFSSGLSLNYDRFDEKLGANIIGNQSYYPAYRKEVVPGAYAQYTLNLDDNLVVLAGLRGDYSNKYGFFATPRLHVKYNVTPWLTARVSAGKGYRTANELVENSFLLASSRRLNIDPSLDRFEEAWNYGASLMSNINIADKNLSLNLEWYYTDFKKQVVIDMDRNPHQVDFYNLNGQSYAQSMQIEATYPFFRGFTLTGAFRYTDVKSTYDGVLREKPLTNRYKALATASYQTPLKKWQFDLTTSFNGGGRMPDPDKTNPLWNDTFKPYVLLNAQVTKNFKNWSVYVGGENLTNYKQKNPIIGADNPWGNDFDGSMVYGPVHGSKLYIGARWSLPR